MSFNTQPPEGGWVAVACHVFDNIVSTRSRPKAAGPVGRTPPRIRCRFNTQPPEGGWNYYYFELSQSARFNTQPPEGGWFLANFGGTDRTRFNTQPPEGGWLHL